MSNFTDLTSVTIVTNDTISWNRIDDNSAWLPIGIGLSCANIGIFFEYFRRGKFKISPGISKNLN